MKRINWKFIVLRLSEAGSYRAIALVLLSIGIQVPDPIWQKVVLICTGMAGLVGVLLPELASPVTTDVGTGNAPIQNPPRAVGTGTPVPLSGEKT